MKDGSLTRVQVKILDETLVLQSAEDPEYIHSIADYVNAKAAEMMKESKGALIGQSLQKLLVIINIADDLFKEREKVKNLELALEKANNDLNEFIEGL